MTTWGGDGESVEEGRAREGRVSKDTPDAECNLNIFVRKDGSRCCGLGVEVRQPARDKHYYTLKLG